MKRLQLQYKANKTKHFVDISNYKRWRNLVLKRLTKIKHDYFESLQTSKSSKPFGDRWVLYFAKKHAYTDSKIILVENEKLLVKNNKISKTLNKYFSLNVNSPEVFEWPTQINRTKKIVYLGFQKKI